LEVTFISLKFILFVVIVFTLYWTLAGKNKKMQNIILLVASYVFYGSWDWRFLFLLFTMAILNYFIGIQIGKKNPSKRLWLILGLILNIGVLVFFKYFNFFIDGFIHLLASFGYNLSGITLKIIIPLGISFSTFLSISYLVDVYKGKLKPESNLADLLLALSFFPIILAGPIQQPSSLLPQMKNLRKFNAEQIWDGLRQILWGLFTKIVIADNLGRIVDKIFDHYPDYTSNSLILAAVFFSIQIYTDFSGYSNIAIGVAKLFDIKLMRNFANPYFAKNITEFWKRWHISLTTWFRDYLFLPIAYSVSNKIKNEKVLFIKTDLFIYVVASAVTWFLTGLWHGANYTFIAWGLIHGFFLFLYQWQRVPRKRIFKRFGISSKNPLITSVEMVFTLIITGTAWIFFRSNTLGDALNYIKALFTSTALQVPVIGSHALSVKSLIILSALFFGVEWFQRHKSHALQIEKMHYILRQAIYSIILLLIFVYCVFNENEFIYQQF